MSEAAAANVRQAVPFFAVSGMETSLRYYMDGLGFTMTLIERSRTLAAPAQIPREALA